MVRIQNGYSWLVALFKGNSAGSDPDDVRGRSQLTIC